MKNELKTMEAYVKELRELKKYDEVQRLNQEVSELKARLSELRSERDSLKKEMLLKKIEHEESDSFNLWHDDKLVDFLDSECNFFAGLTNEGTGLVEVPVEALQKAVAAGEIREARAVGQEVRIEFAHYFAQLDKLSEKAVHLGQELERSKQELQRYEGVKNALESHAVAAEAEK